jgi:Tfp pilus assembly protein PilO
MGRFKDLLLKLKWSTVIVLIAVGVGLTYYMLDQTEIERREQSIESAKGEISSLERKIQEAKEFEKQFEEKKRRYAELVKQLQALQGALPKEFLLPDLLSDLLGEAKQLELEVTKFKPDEKETPGELYTSLGFDLDMRGTFLQFLVFLDRMATMKRLVTVQKIVIDKDDSRKNVTLGGAEGAFGGTRLTGGRTVYPGLTAVVRLMTYRYRGAPGSNSTPMSSPAGARKGGR